MCFLITFTFFLKNIFTEQTKTTLHIMNLRFKQMQNIMQTDITG